MSLVLSHCTTTTVEAAGVRPALHNHDAPPHTDKSHALCPPTWVGLPAAMRMGDPAGAFHSDTSCWVWQSTTRTPAPVTCTRSHGTPREESVIRCKLQWKKPTSKKRRNRTNTLQQLERAATSAVL
jgi:hypothetical protein